MKVLVVYYSRTGNTRRIAEKIAAAANADIVEVLDRKKRGGAIGFFLGGKDSVTKSATEIEHPHVNLAEYDLIFIGTPVWASDVTPAIRTFLGANPMKGRKVAFFCTTSVSGIENTLESMNGLSQGAKVVSRLGLRASEIKDEKLIEDKIAEMLKKIGIQ